MRHHHKCRFFIIFYKGTKNFPHGMKFKAFTLLKNLKLSPERTSMEAVTEKQELKQEIRAENGNVFCF